MPKTRMGSTLAHNLPGMFWLRSSGPEKRK
jgi:hypothetical protein